MRRTMEMFLGMAGAALMVASVVQAQPPGGPRRGMPSPDQILQRLDRNDDGNLTKEEMPPLIAERLSRADTDGDGTITKKELQAFHKQRAQSRPQAQPSGDEDAQAATYEEIEPLGVEFGRLTTLRLRSDGALLASDAAAKEIKVISPEGKQVGALKLEFAPEAVDIDPDGTIYCGGQGRIAKLDSSGRVLKAVKVPDDVAPPPSEQRRATSRPQRISGIAVSEKDVFVAFGSGWSVGSKSKLYRFDRQLENPLQLAEGLRGCCQRCDITAREGVLYLAENSAHRVVLYDREGQVLSKWGERSRTGLEGFGSCCNPMNLCFGPDGVLYTAESGLGRVKRYTADGKLLGLVGYVGTDRFDRGGGLAASCSNIAIAVSSDGERVFVMDYKNNRIRVLKKKG